MSNKTFRDFLESLVHKRMTIKEIENKINNFLESKNVYVVKSSLHWNNFDIPDYNLVGSTEIACEENKKIPFCDFDIYVLPTKERVGRNIVYYITEVAYDFVG